MVTDGLMVKSESSRLPASPIRKCYVAFSLAKLIDERTLYSFENRAESPEANLIVRMTFENEYSKESKEALPRGEFALNGAFYQTGDLKVQPRDFFCGYVFYENVGKYAEGLHEDDPDILESARWLRFIAQKLCECCDRETIVHPPAIELEKFFLYSGNYAEMQQRLRVMFQHAQETEKLIPILYDVMTEYLNEKVRHASGMYLDKILNDERFLFWFFQMLPFCIAPESTVADILNAFLPIIYASGIDFDLKKFLAYRLDRGREFLGRFAELEFDDEGEIAVEKLKAAILKNRMELQPSFPEVIPDSMTGQERRTLAEALIWNTWNAGAIWEVPDRVKGIIAYLLENELQRELEE